MRGRGGHGCAALNTNAALARQRQKLVLVVDDNEAILRALDYGLRRSGFRVLCATHGAPALEILKGPQGPEIDVVLTDVVMPGGMNGLELARAARRLRGELPILLTSGYATGIFDSLGASPMEFPLIAKPSSVGELAALLRRMIDAAETW